MLVTGRGAAEILQEVGLTRERARRLLLAGFAGEGRRTRGALLYDEERVRALTTWPRLEPHAVDALCPGGLFVVRVGPGRSLDLTTGWAQRCEAVRGDWDISPFVRVRLRLRIEQHGAMPLVATVSGYVALVADIVEVTVDVDGRTGFELTEPGEWSTGLRGRRLVTGPGRSWLLRR